MWFLLFTLGICAGMVGIESPPKRKTIRGARITGVSAGQTAASQPFNNVWTS